MRNWDTTDASKSQSMGIQARARDATQIKMKTNKMEMDELLCVCMS